MRIGIDIDDTITDTSKSIKEVLVKNGLNDVSEDFDSHKEEDLIRYHDLIYKNIDNVLSNCDIKNDASNIINRLKDEGNQIFLITARNNKYSKNVESITIKYLEKYGIKYDGLLFDYHDKKSVCEHLNLDFMLDDNYNVITSLKDSTVKGILFNTDQNKVYNYDGESVSSWIEFYDYLNNYKENN